MANYTAKNINDMQAALGGGLIRARAELGVTSFGMQVVRLPGDYNDYPEHDHEQDGQEEVYVTLAGSGWIDIDGERVDLEKDVLIRIPAGTKRKLHSGPDGVQMLVLGGCPGKAYEPASFSELETA